MAAGHFVCIAKSMMCVYVCVQMCTWDLFYCVLNGCVHCIANPCEGYTYIQYFLQYKVMLFFRYVHIYAVSIHVISEM